ncbi:MAG: hypothetical protein CMJ31_01610 [Phycisphaerae bacterium]|nr:hypothetical protein [Phycisphaerae bacterium]
MPFDPGAPASSTLAVCSWSLAPDGPQSLARTVSGQLGLDRLQLALDPIRTGAWQLLETRSALDDAGVTIVSGMMAPQDEDYSSIEAIRRTGGFRRSETWKANLDAAEANANLAADLGLTLVTMHAGAIPSDPGPDRSEILDRLRSVVDIFDARGVRVAFETGQERAADMRSALDDLDRPSAGINFDPANVLLYGAGDPIDALLALLPRVVQCHLKDATPSSEPDEWGTEVPVGQGAVDWPAFLKIVSSAPRPLDLVIEREAGPSRVEDVRAAIGYIETLRAEPEA